MYLELKHLRAVKAIHDAGGLARAADHLNLTQSALSHQVKALERLTGVDLFVRRAKPMRLSPAGERVLRLAQQVLPEVARTEAELQGDEAGRSGRLHIAIECHACFDWLLPVLDMFRKSWPDIDVDIRPGLSFGALPALLREEVDLVVSSDPETDADILFSPLFDYEAVFVASRAHRLATRKWIEAQDFSEETLITYPVEREKLDIFSQLLSPAGVEPAAVRPVELTAVILMLVASNRGVAVLPDWVVRTVRGHPDYITRPLTEQGITRRLYAATRAEDVTRPYIAHFMRLARSEPMKMQRAETEPIA